MQIASNNSKGSVAKNNYHLLTLPVNYKENWFEEEIRRERANHNANLRKGMVDTGFLWPSLYLEIFLEGVFTMRVIPFQIEVEVPKGLFRLTAVSREDNVAWVIRNDTFGCIAEINPKQLFDWAIKTYPNGIGLEGYHILAFKLLTTGCKDESEKKAIWESSFYHNSDGGFAKL